MSDTEPQWRHICEVCGVEEILTPGDAFNLGWDYPPRMGQLLVRGAALLRHRSLQAVDPDRLSDAELVSYLTQCRDHHASMMTQHMRYTAGALLPTGDFLAQAGDWAGLPPAEAMAPPPPAFPALP